MHRLIRSVPDVGCSTEHGLNPSTPASPGSICLDERQNSVYSFCVVLEKLTFVPTVEAVACSCERNTRNNKERVCLYRKRESINKKKWWQYQKTKNDKE
jgi:hypothetical protein